MNKILIISLSVIWIMLFSACKNIPIEFLEPPQSTQKVEDGLTKFYPLNGNTKEFVSGSFTSFSNTNNIVWDKAFREDREINFASFPSGFQLSDSTGLPNSFPNFTLTFWLNKKTDTTLTPILIYGNEQDILALFMNNQKIYFLIRKDGIIQTREFAVETINDWNFIAIAMDKSKLYAKLESPVGTLFKWKGENYDRGISLNMDFSLPQDGVLMFGNIFNTHEFESEWDDIRIYNRMLSDQEVIAVKNYVE